MVTAIKKFIEFWRDVHAGKGSSPLVPVLGKCGGEHVSLERLIELCNKALEANCLIDKLDDPPNLRFGIAITDGDDRKLYCTGYNQLKKIRKFIV